MQEKELMLSIYIATYGHEEYIRQALDSILMQKTDYKFEVLVGEDNSPDNTRKILKEYEEKYPHIFTMFYREKNMNNELITNAQDLIARCTGKYIIALEGDDYWIDSLKINKQIKFLEEHPDYLAVAHHCVVVDQNSKPKDEKYPECQEEEYTFNHFASEIMPGQLTTVMYRNVQLDEAIDISLLKKKLVPGDRALYFFLLANGKVYCMNEVMSAYRHVTECGLSWSANYKYSFEQWDYFYRSLIKYSNQNQNMKAKKYAEFLFLRNIIKGVKEKQCHIKCFFDYLLNDKGGRRSLFLYLKYKFNKDILHKKICV